MLVNLLALESEKNFEEFCQALLGEEFPRFQAFSAPDLGMDGYDSESQTIFQAYFPERAPRKDKIQVDIEKAKKTSWPCKRWVLLLPKNPTPKLIQWLQQEKRSSVPFALEVWGKTKIEGLLAKYPKVKEAYFPSDAEQAEELEERQSEKALSREVYRPVHEELDQTSSRVERRLYCDNPVAWPRIQASGLVGKIDSATRQKLEHFYDVARPNYQASWMEASQEWEQLLKKWDSLYGSALPEGYNQRHFDWWNFLLAEKCSGIGIVLGTVEGMKILGAYLTVERFMSGISLEQFLRERWNEAKHIPRFARYRASRSETLEEIKKVMEHLAGKIRV